MQQMCMLTLILGLLFVLLPARALAEEVKAKVFDGGNVKFVETSPGSGWYKVCDLNGKASNEIVDELTVKTFTSTAPNPTQESLNKILDQVDRIKVLGCGMYIDKAQDEKKVLIDTASAADITSFKLCMQISEDPKSFNHCMCLGYPTIALLCKDKLIALIGCQHGRAIRWSQWHWDAALKEPKRLAVWFADKGFPGQLKEVLEAEKAAAPYIHAWETWRAECPPCLALKDRSEADHLAQFGTDGLRTAQPGPAPKELIPCTSAISKNYTTHKEAIWALLKWAGHDTVLEDNSYPYERLPDRLLDTYSLAEIVEVIGKTDDPAVLDGAIRYLTRMGTAVNIPVFPPPLNNAFTSDIKAKLIARAEASGKWLTTQSLRRLFAIPKSDAELNRENSLEKLLSP